jgi:hypothetical protein
MNTLPDHLAHVTSLTADDLHVDLTVVGRYEVQTDYMPVGAHAGKYETEIFSDEDPDLDEWRTWTWTREDAVAMHAKVVAALREGRDLDEAVAR